MEDDLPSVPETDLGVVRLYRRQEVQPGSETLETDTVVPEPGLKVPNEQSPDGPTLSPGETLRRTREDRGISLTAVGLETRIPQRFLRALEDDEPIDAFPSRAYARLFLCTYARQLGLDEKSLLESFDALHPHVDDDPVKLLVPAVPPPSRLAPRLTVLAAGILLFAIVLRALQLDNRVPPASRTFPERAVAAPSPSEQNRAASARALVGSSPATARFIVAALRLSGPCWMKATADGRTILQRLAQPGEHLRIHARARLNLVLGNAGGVRLWLNDRPIRTGPSGQVLHLSFALHGSTLRVFRTPR